MGKWGIIKKIANIKNEHIENSQTAMAGLKNSLSIFIIFKKHEFQRKRLIATFSCFNN